MSARPRLLTRLAGALALATLLSAPAGAQTFAVGFGGGPLYDMSEASRVSGFDTWGGHVFGEMRLESNVVLQLRVSRFGLRSVSANSPTIVTTGVDLAAGYLFRSDWFYSGFLAGLGGYHLDPKSAGPEQAVFETIEKEFGWFGGVVTIFDLGSRFDARMEATIHFIHSDPRRRPIQLGAAVAYRF